MGPASKLPRGTRVDRYEVDQLLGEGAYGAVYRARHVLTEQWVALKVLRCDASDTEAFDRLVREARAVAQVGSARVVRVFDCGVAAQEQLGFLAMELLTGCDLADLVQREGPLGVERAVDIVVQMLEGLTVAHDRGIVHRDMKPANVFVTRTEATAGPSQDFVKLLDFGISKMRRADAVMTAPGLTMGTPGYIAPEQIGNARDADGRADLFSVAVILYELLTRQKPYSTRSYHEFVAELQAGKARPIRELAPHVPESLAKVVERGLARDPDARWQTARTFAAALRGIGELTLPSLSAAATPTLRRDDTPLTAPAQSHVTHSPRMPPVSVTAPTLMVESSSPRTQHVPPPGMHASQPPQPTTAGAMVQTFAPAPQPADRTPLLLTLIAIGLGLTAIIGGVGIYLALRPAPSGAPSTTTVVAKPPSDDVDDEQEPAAKKKPKKHDESTNGFKPPPKKEPKPEPEEESSAGALASSSGVEIEEPRVVSAALDTAEIRRVLKKSITGMDECRRTTAEHVMAAVHVHPVGKITLAGPAPDNKGNENAARCVAERFKEAAKGWVQPSDASGIIFFEVDLKKK
jgi:eukaryotic-like serine/threonine-protein kinase